MIGASGLALISYTALILAYSLTRSSGLALADYLYNSRKTELKSTLASVIAGNIGAGTIYGIYSFAVDRPLLGASVALSYALGLMLAGAISPSIRKACVGLREVSLVGFLSERHQVAPRWVWVVWSSVGAVFMLQLAVQLLAVGDVISQIFGTTREAGVLIGACAVGSYIVVGGYRSATVSDHLQAPLVIGMLAIVGGGMIVTALGGQTIQVKGWDADKIAPVAALVLVAPAVFLSVDNWHRIVAADSDRTAAVGFMSAAFFCLLGYGIVVLAAIMNGPGVAPAEGLRSFLPQQVGWLVPVVISVAIFSIMDTTIPPLVAGMPGSERSLSIARLYTVAIFVLVSVVALALGSIVQGIVAAFSSLAVFLPAVAAAIFRKRNRPYSVLLGIPISVCAAIGMTFVLAEYALVGSVLLSAVLYFSLAAIEGRLEQHRGSG